MRPRNKALPNNFREARVVANGRQGRIPVPGPG
jgi:hypothetical protein